MKKIFTAITFLIVAAATVSAATIKILNPSFESLSLGCNQCYAADNVPSWSASGASTFQGGSSFSGIPNGVNVVAIGSGGTVGTLSQTLSATLAANTLYTLSFFVGQRNDVVSSPYTVLLEANGATLASDSGGSPAPGQFVSRTITYDSGANPAQLGQALLIMATSGSGTGQTSFDNFTLTAVSSQSAVPEPATFGFAALFAIALMGIRARRPGIAVN